jgi:hypothetical protein
LRHSRHRRVCIGNTATAHRRTKRAKWPPLNGRYQLAAAANNLFQSFP